jgi:hypothetical protein
MASAGTYPLTVAWMGGDTEAGVILGQLSYGTRELQMNVWKAVPPASGATPFYLEIRDQWHAFEQAKAISAETVEGLLGEPADILLARKRRTA